MTQQIKLSAVISKKYVYQRLDQVLAKIFLNHSRSCIKEWILNKYVLVNNKIWDEPKKKVLGGELINISVKIEEKICSKAENIPISIIYEDSDIVIINKPKNMVVHPGINNHKGTLLNALLNYYPPINNIPRAGIVHRLDKDTTGLMVIAKTVPAHMKLVDSLKLHAIIREYEALVFGQVKANGKIIAPIGRHPINRTRMSIRPTGKHAVTYYRIAEYFRIHTRLRLRLETGRTHQIRVHMAYISHPLVGDQVYGSKQHMPKKASKTFTTALHEFNRQALHANMLRLYHPITGIKMEWHAPTPKDMMDLIKIMRDDFEEHKNDFRF